MPARFTPFSLPSDHTSDGVARRVHFIGVCGVGMAGVAALLARKGWIVSGEDARPNELVPWLQAHNIQLLDAPPQHVDLCVRTTAVGLHHPHVLELRARGVPVVQRGEVLAALVGNSRALAICGTHGKTTTSCFATRLLQEVGRTVCWCIGGQTKSLGGVAGGDFGGQLVVEADESDGTLSRYHPEVLVATNLDLDHLEHFADESDLCDCFATVAGQTRSAVAYCSDAPRLCRTFRSLNLPQSLTFGFGMADLQAEDIQCGMEQSYFKLRYRGKLLGEAHIGVLGRHNVLNALGALAGVHLLTGISFTDLLPYLAKATSELPQRRYEVALARDGLQVVADYAHHPAEIAAALAMARLKHSGRLRILFQPHRFTRTLALRQEFPPAFKLADEVVLLPVYAASEPPLPGGESHDLYAEFRRQTTQRILLATTLAEATSYFRRTLAAGDLLLIVGAGDVIHVAERLRTLNLPQPTKGASLAPWSGYGTGGEAEELLVGGPPAAGARLVGCGSNTWFSDLGYDGTVQVLRSTIIPEGNPPETDYPGELIGSVLLEHLAANGWSGLEFMTGIPGTLGGWLKSNAGAHGHAIGEAVARVDIDGTPFCPRFTYRCSNLQGRVTAVRFILRRDEPLAIRARQDEYRSRRIDLHGLRTCGSLFKNPPGDSAGRLIEQCGLKGFRIGGAQIAPFHANILAAGTGCTSSDLLAVMLTVQGKVLQQTGVRLLPEVSGFPSD